MGIQALKGRDNLLLNTGSLHQVLIGIGGNGKTVRYSNALGGQVLVHLAQGGVFAADQVYIVNADIIKPENQFFVVRVTHV